MPRRTALVVPVPEATPYYDGPAGVPGHVTVLFPFVDDDAIDEHELELLFTGIDAFDFVLERLEAFDDGTTWLAPEPMGSFSALTAMVWQRWPDQPPYEGAHDDPTPHVTIMRAPAALPIACRASEVWLLVEQPDGGFTKRRSFVLG
jgi:hypothetical protein